MVFIVPRSPFKKKMLFFWCSYSFFPCVILVGLCSKEKWPRATVGAISIMNMEWVQRNHRFNQGLTKRYRHAMCVMFFSAATGCSTWIEYTRSFKMYEVYDMGVLCGWALALSILTLGQDLDGFVIVRFSVHVGILNIRSKRLFYKLCNETRNCQRNWASTGLV